MPHSKSTRFFTWFAFLAVITVIAILYPPEGPFNLNYHWSADTVKDNFMNGDPGSYIRGGEHLLQFHNLSCWQAACWPPGMFVVTAGLIKFFGPQHYVFSSLVLAILFWSVALFAVYAGLTAIRNPFVRFFFVSSVWLFFPFRDWMLGEAIIYSESKAIPLFLLAVALLVLGLEEGKKRYFIGSGVALAGATYIRSYFDLTANMVFGVLWIVSFLLVVSPYLWQVYKRELKFDFNVARTWITKNVSVSKRRDLLRASLLFGAFLVCIVPWKLRNLKVLHTFGLTTCHQAIWLNHWLTDEKMPSFLITGNTACHTAPETCAFVNGTPAGLSSQSTLPPQLSTGLARRFAVMTFLFQPFKWMKYKIKNFYWFWFGRPWDSHDSFNRYYVEGTITLCLALWSFLLAVKNIFSTEVPVRWFSWVMLLFFLQNCLTFTFFHYEYRYSIPIKLFYYFAPFFLMSLRARPERKAV